MIISLKNVVLTAWVAALKWYKWYIHPSLVKMCGHSWTQRINPDGPIINICLYVIYNRIQDYRKIMTLYFYIVCLTLFMLPRGTLSSWWSAKILNPLCKMSNSCISVFTNSIQFCQCEEHCSHMRLASFTLLLLVFPAHTSYQSGGTVMDAIVSRQCLLMEWNGNLGRSPTPDRQFSLSFR